MFTGKSLMSALLTNGFWYKLIVNLSSSILFFGCKFTHLFSDGRVYYFCINLVGGKEWLSSRGGGRLEASIPWATRYPPWFPWVSGLKLCVEGESGDQNKKNPNSKESGFELLSHLGNSTFNIS